MRWIHRISQENEFCARTHGYFGCCPCRLELFSRCLVSLFMDAGKRHSCDERWTPNKGTYWFPAYNSSAGVKALEFIKEQIGAGIKPLKNNPAKLFVDRKLAVLQSDSSLPGAFPRQQSPTIGQRIDGYHS